MCVSCYFTEAISVSIYYSSTTTLTISWTLYDVNATEYTISYSNTDCPNEMYNDIKGISASETMYTLTYLEEGTDYSITVTAILSEGGTAVHIITASTVSVG